MKRKAPVGIITLTMLLMVASSISGVAASSQQHTIQFDVYFISGDNVARDFYIAVDGLGNTVAHNVFWGSGTLSTTITLESTEAHSVYAWPIINHDRSRYGGSLIVDGQVCNSSPDISQDLWLGCNIFAQPAPAQPSTVTFTVSYVQGDQVLRNVYYNLDGGSQNLLSTVFESGSWSFTATFTSIHVFVNVNPGTIYFEQLYINGQLVASGYVGNEGLTYGSGGLTLYP